MGQAASFTRGLVLGGAVGSSAYFWMRHTTDSAVLSAVGNMRQAQYVLRGASSDTQPVDVIDEQSASSGAVDLASRALASKWNGWVESAIATVRDTSITPWLNEKVAELTGPSPAEATTPNTDASAPVPSAVSISTTDSSVSDPLTSSSQASSDPEPASAQSETSTTDA